MAESNEVIEYNSDPRAPCKYGSSCYRKNKTHLDKFKHPPGTCKEDATTNRRKKQKTDDALFDSTGSHSKNEEGPPSLKKLKTTGSDVAESINKVVDVKVRNSDTTSEGQTASNEEMICTQSNQLELKSDVKGIIKQLFLVDMPDDFYSFWEMCAQLNSTNPLDALKDVKLKLVGPFDVLAGKVKEVFDEDRPAFLRHWRFYYDPPECQTVLASTASCFHIGYYRDDPKEMPIFLVSNSMDNKNPEKNGQLKVIGPNLFSAFNAYLEELKTDPFSRMKIPNFQKTLNEWTKEKGFSLERTSKQMEARSRNVVAKTFHGAGIVVPVDKKNDVGYRELAASNVTIRKILKGIAESKSDEERTKFWEQLQPVITFASIANDECDFGTSLELGLDLFSYGSDLLHCSVLQLLLTAYELLQRPQFAFILQAHLEDRKKGNQLSIL